MPKVTRSPSYLIHNPHSYCFRIIVPKDLQPYIGKKELRRSLRTGYMSVARQKARAMAAEVQTLFLWVRETVMKGDLADGDSITVLAPGNKQVKIRLHGIDCPEGGQAFGRRAKQFTSSQCFGTSIRYREVDIDRYGRTVATVYLEDGRELNLEILKAGLAWHYRRYSKRQDYADAEEEARASRLGLWVDPNAMPPWEWRRERRKGNAKYSQQDMPSIN